MALSWKHVVPWANRSEFVQTYLDLYSKNSERQKKAVETIALWKCRASNKLSVAIESSAALTTAYLKYQKAQEAKKLHLNDEDVRIHMTLAIIRFVNHVTEKGQNKAFAQPVHKIADEFGIPEWIVRLRHEGSHGSIPCLDLLVRGVQWALTYLQEVFWSQQVKEADEDTDPSSRKRKRPYRALYNTGEIQALLRSYQKASYESLGEDADSESAREKRRALRRLELILKAQQRNSVLRCMVESGHLLPTEQQLHSYHINIEETLRAEPPKVPQVLIKVWKDLIQSLQDRQLMRLLLQHVITAMLKETDHSSLTSLASLAWLRLVLLYETANFSKMREERESQQALFSGAVDFSRHLLLDTCQQNINTLTISLLRLVAPPGTYSEDTFRKLEELNAVYKGGTAACPDKGQSDKEKETQRAEESPSKDVPSTESLSKLANATANEEEDIWKLCTDPIDWEWVPIGVPPSEAGVAGLGSVEEHHSDSNTSTSEDDDRSDSKSSEEEQDTSLRDSHAQDTRRESPEKSEKVDIAKKIHAH